MNEQFRLRVRILFEEAADLPLEERGEFLNARCGDAPEVRAEVESLLAYDAGFGSGEGEDAIPQSPLLRAIESTVPDAAPASQGEARALPPTIGGYRVLRRHGEGGMGTVFEAVQENPRRTVALKVIRAGLVSPELVGRFQHEAQILARLQHPGVAQVYEAGVSDDGQPYFAMQFIRGMPLDKYVRSRGLDVAACLELLALVCDAVQHAHDKGVVHRDLKPGNILVDEFGQPKILDFGVAHVTAADLLNTSSLTRTGQLLGTLSYMSPEQLTSRSSGLDGRSDVYTLGVILFELLAHRLPYDLDQLPLHEVARVIDQKEPSRLGSIDRRCRGDVEIIVAKALEKRRTLRYASAHELAADIRRHLRGEAIVARPVGTAERCWRWVRRNPLLTALAGVLAGVLVAATIASALAAGRFASLAERARLWSVAERKARLAADRASNAADTAREAALTEAYRAMLSEVRALRAGHQPGWRDKALGDLARLAVAPIVRRNFPELRTEAAAVLATADISLARRLELPAADLGSFAFSPDGRTLLTACGDSRLEFWDLPAKTRLSSAKGLAVPESGFDKVLYLPGGSSLALSTRDHGVVFTDSRGARSSRAAITRGKSQPVKLAASARGDRLAVAWTGSAGITVHDLATGALLERFPGSPFALRPDGRWLACSENSEIALVPIASKDSRIVLGRKGGARALAFSPDGTLLAAAFLDHTVVLWNVAKREQLGMLRGHRERVVDVAFSPDGGWIATASLDYTVRIWETRTGQNVAILPSSTFARRVRWSPTGDFLATSPDLSRAIFLYRVTGRRTVQQWLAGHSVELACVAAHPRRERVATSGYSELMLWNLGDARPSPITIGPESAAGTALAYSSDGSLLASACWGGAGFHEIVLRDAETGNVRRRISSREIVYALAFDSTGDRLASGDSAGNVIVWDVATGQPLRQFATGAEVRSIVFLEGPRRLVTHGKDAVLVFDIASGKLDKTVAPAGGGIRTMAADPARRRLLVALQSGGIASLSLPELAPGPHLEKAHDSGVECLAWSPDGQLLATAGADRRVVLRDAATLETILSFPLWAGTPRNLAFDCTGRHLAVVGSDCDVDLWDIYALREGLTSINLAWDQPTPAKSPAPGGALAAEPIGGSSNAVGFEQAPPGNRGR
jgi:WD40 repeat protein